MSNSCSPVSGGSRRKQAGLHGIPARVFCGIRRAGDRGGLRIWRGWTSAWKSQSQLERLRPRSTRRTATSLWPKAAVEDAGRGALLIARAVSRTPSSTTAPAGAEPHPSSARRLSCRRAAKLDLSRWSASPAPWAALAVNAWLFTARRRPRLPLHVRVPISAFTPAPSGGLDQQLLYGGVSRGVHPLDGPAPDRGRLRKRIARRDG
jgi:hypothetical protein